MATSSGTRSPDRSTCCMIPIANRSLAQATAVGRRRVGMSTSARPASTPPSNVSEVVATSCRSASRRPAPLHRRAGAGEPVGHLARRLGDASDEGDPTVARLEQVGHRQAPAAHVVDRHRAGAARRAGVVEQHQRHPAVTATHRGAVLARRHVEDAEHLLLREHAEVALLLLRFRSLLHRITSTPAALVGVLDAAGDVGEERVGDVEHDQPDRAALPAAQLAGRLVAHEAEARRSPPRPAASVASATRSGRLRSVRTRCPPTRRHDGRRRRSRGRSAHRRSAIDTVRIGAYHTRVESVQLNRFTSRGSATAGASVRVASRRRSGAVSDESSTCTPPSDEASVCDQPDRQSHDRGAPAVTLELDRATKAFGCGPGARRRIDHAATPVRRTPCSARTVPASRPWSRSWPACTSPTAASCASTASRSVLQPARRRRARPASRSSTRSRRSSPT